MKLERFKEHDHKRIFIVMFTISCILLLAGVFLYKTFAVFTVTTNKNMIEGKVGNNGDLYFAYYVNDTINESMPQKNTGYYFDTSKSNCNNGASITWLNDMWAPAVRNMTTTRTKCNLYFTSTYSDTSGANTPTLFQGLIPITYNASGAPVVADTTTDWYNYTDHKWANAVLVNAGDSTIKNKYFDSGMNVLSSMVGQAVTESDILQYYVWIPRYKYLLWNAENGSSEEQAISITFEKNTDTKSTGTTNGTWLTHPAFTFGSTELSGFWAGKFETSNNTTTPKIIPNVESLVSISVGNAFNSLRSEDQSYASTYGLSTSEIDTHMMKNMEWGAIAYLSSSIYGRYTSSGNCISSGCEVWINNTHTGTGCGVNGDYSVAACGGGITGCSGSSVSAGVANSMTACASGYDWKQNGVNASTTGNQYGIYDMSGGAWEYVMGNMVDSNGNYYSSYAGLAQPNTKYYDSYAYQSDVNIFTDHARGGIGDATKETLKTIGSDTGGWYSDYVHLPSGVASWFRRGGYAYDGSAAGVFIFGRTAGAASTYDSFRAVLSAQ